VRFGGYSGVGRASDCLSSAAQPLVRIISYFPLLTLDGSYATLSDGSSLEGRMCPDSRFILRNNTAKRGSERIGSRNP
jgi:hypothetical protein